MKALFAVLLCLILMTSQSFAIHGSPFGVAGVTTTGTFSGSLKPNKVFNPGVNSIGLFTINFPATGLGTGTVVIFAAALTYSGDFQGIADPGSAQVTGEIDAKSTVTIGILSTVETASGRLQATIKLQSKNISILRLTGVASQNRPDLGADVQFSATANNPFTEIKYDVLGFRQGS